MSISIQNQTKLRLIKQLEDKIKINKNVCAYISEILKQKGVDITSLANMGLSQEEMQLISNYFTYKNDEVSCTNKLYELQHEEQNIESKNNQDNHMENGRKFDEIRQAEERYKEEYSKQEKNNQNKVYEENYLIFER